MAATVAGEDRTTGRSVDPQVRPAGLRASGSLTEQLLRGSHRRSQTIGTFLRQLPFTVAITILVGWRAVGDRAVLTNQGVMLGALLVLLATVLPLIVPWHRTRRHWTVIVPLLDIVAVFVFNIAGFNANEALVLPVIWMASSFGLVGTMVGIMLADVSVWSGQLVPAAGLTAEESPQHLILLPLVLMGAGIFTYLTERRSLGRQALLRSQSTLLEEITDDARERQATVEAILNTIDVGVVVLGPDGRIAMTNRMHNRTLGGILQTGETVDAIKEVRQFQADGQTPLDPDDIPFVRARRGEYLHHVVMWAELGGDDEPNRRAFRISVEQLRAGDRPLGAVIAYHDLTAEMEALNQLDDFVSSVSHELRTPLTSIVGYLDLAIEDDRVPDEVRAFLEIANRNSERLLALIGDLLTAAQLRRGELEIRASVVDLREIVQEAVESEEPRAIDLGVTIINYAIRPCIVRVDGTRIGQVVDNLLSNAIKYSRKEGTVEIRLDAGPDGVRLSFTDDGIGISEEDQRRLFRRFFRARAVRKGSIQGSGLGLHISNQIVTAHGGEIQVESELGKGTTFTVCLPATVLERS